MMMAKKKRSAKNKSQSKKISRRTLTSIRIVRYGVDSFLRNAWLSIAATAVMTITLLIVFVTFAAQNILTDTVRDLSDKVDMSIYLKTDTPDDKAAEIQAEIEKLSSVRSVNYISAKEARDQIANENSSNPDVLEAIKEATNKNPGTLRVVVEDINDTSELENFVGSNELLKKYLSDDYEPSFAGERRETIKSIGRMVRFIQQLGIIVGAVFVIISSLIIFNTIRMAIFNRKEEIQMMKLIGADKSFVRGPFLVEAMIYGVIAALLATGIGVWGLYSVRGTLSEYQINITPTIGLANSYMMLVVLAMIGIGALIGMISSLLATRRHLKL